MSLIADILFLLAALAAAFYCRVLATRLKSLGNTDKGIGGAISTLSVQVDEMRTALSLVGATADKRTARLERVTKQAEASARRLELLLASLHEAGETPSPSPVKKPVLKLSPEDRSASARGPESQSRSISRMLLRKPNHRLKETQL